MASKKKIYARGAALLLLALTLPGCLPLGAPTIIGLVLDGFSVVATGKTVSDHGLSMLAQRDCSVGRAVLTGVDLCVGDVIPPGPVAENPVRVVKNIELASRADDGDNPLYSSLHPSRWPSYSDTR